MCGLAGWVSFDQDLTRRIEVLDAMTETMACRGPDDRGSWVGRHVALGHRRLAVIDIEGGTQPMAVSPDDAERDTVAMVYTGEAYNFIELRDELRRRGHRFRTGSDTEVVLRGYLEWGEAVAERLNGMYAFAIWDTRTDRLVIVRDRLGIKPFYYLPTGDGVVFGSEPKAILAHPAAERVVDADGLRELLCFTKTPGRTVWSGMREVRPGSVLTVDRTGISEHVYWRLDTAAHTDDLAATTTRVRELLDDAVGRQLRSDVPRCVLLSGGLDSSAITALAAAHLREQGESLRTFSVDFLGHEENFKAEMLRSTPDAPYVRDMVAHVGARHQDIVLDDAALTDPDIRRRAIAARDLPTGNGATDVSLYLLFQAIREHSTVAISGESSDEVFGGYAWFHQPAVQQADTFPWVAAFAPEEAKKAAVPLYDADLLASLDVDQYVRDTYADAVAEVGALAAESEHERRMRVICYLHLTRFLPVLLDRKDRISMAVGLEVRVPFCDHRLIEYVYNTPWAMKTHDSREKSLLRSAVADVLPASVVQRVKTPYPTPQSPTYTTELQQQVGAFVTDPDHPVHQIVNRGLVEAVAKLDPTAVDPASRLVLERCLDLAYWFDLYRPSLRLP